MNPLKKLVGAIAFPLLWLWAWLSQPCKRNRGGLK